MIRLLAVDTATEACSAAIWSDGDIVEEFREAPREHGRLILPMVDRLLSQVGLKLSQLDGLAFGRGPGAFTGVRIAAGVVQGLALGADLPVAGVSDLAALAQRAFRERAWSKLIACMDARMHEVYCGRFIAGAEGLVRAQAEEAVLPPEQVPLPVDGGWYGVGRGFGAYPALGESLAAVDAESLPTAGDIVRLAVDEFAQGNAFPAERAIPVYLRNEVAWKKAD